MKTWKNDHRHPERAEWPEGEWTDEPDKAVWIDEATGLDCMIHRNRLGGLCGYVGVGPDHPLHGKHYDADEVLGVEIHGGLTYADGCWESDGDESYGICHVPEPGRPHDVWWFGFDCLHLGDTSPGEIVTHRRFNDAASRLDRGVYRNFAYVKAETEALAGQLVKR